jgi:hypothetical protein
MTRSKKTTRQDDESTYTPGMVVIKYFPRLPLGLQEAVADFVRTVAEERERAKATGGAR